MKENMLFPNYVWSITKWDKNGFEIDSIYFHSRIPIWIWGIITRFIVIPAPHQRDTQVITMYRFVEETTEFILWERN